MTTLNIPIRSSCNTLIFDTIFEKLEYVDYSNLVAVDEHQVDCYQTCLLLSDKLVIVGENIDGKDEVWVLDK